MARDNYSPKKNLISKAAKARINYLTGGRTRRKSAYYALSRYPSRLNGANLGIGNKTVTLVKSAFREDAITTSLLSPTYYGVDFKLSEISDYLSIQQLYDQYRINWVEVTLLPKINSTGQVTVTTGLTQSGAVATACDFDSSVILNTSSSMASMTEYSSFKLTRGTSLHKRKLVPASISAVSNTANGSMVMGGVPQRQVWLDTQQPNVPHYGLRVFVEDSEAYTYSYDIIIKYCISLRCSR